MRVSRVGKRERHPNTKIQYGFEAFSRPASRKSHYKGCVLAAADILELACTRACQERCAKHEPKSCALLHFAQANAVKCVSSTSKEMRFVQWQRIPDYLSLGLQEAIELKADLIVLQSPALEDVFYELLRQQGTVADIDESTGTVLWTASQRRTVVLTLRHPSSYRYSGPWQTVWDRDVAPKLELVRKLLAAEST